ncbi:uncharacterized protein EI97DRAFT_171725 [Westerdykella ornata]|uniref:Uncharacterized protein n=1 Tax=Westerdykella ornata TaxID=318751 RepID=A0A6A6JW59_WESOR|nr:uncharacterized protein EI97DRAFT_171725 [Westerdykella ornata]KAF2279289.1 hypothetical protein EI97DRAFT_171725 [Westerdykella ornata]
MAHRALPGEQSASWLAMSYGCCAPRRESLDRDDRALLRENGEKEMQICYEQPQIIPPPRAEPIRHRPSTSHSVGRHVSQWVSNGREFATRASSRASSYTLSRPRKSLSRQRLSIGRPSDFRRYDGVDGIQSMLDEASMPVPRRRRSFTPLELSIYLPENRLSPLPDFGDDSWEELQKPPQALIRDRQSLASESSFLIQRKPVASISARDSIHNAAWPPTFTYTTSASPSSLPFLHEEPKQQTTSPIPTPARPTLQRANTQTSIASRSSSRLLSRLPSPSRTRSNTAASLPSLARRATSKSTTETDEDIDAAIRELNTIVEERRAASALAAAEAYRSRNQSPACMHRVPPSPSQHVPAIAPSLRMRVRSETLVEIGSAFSAPLVKDVDKALPTTPGEKGQDRMGTRKLTLYPPGLHQQRQQQQQQKSQVPGGPLTSNPITPTTTTVLTPTTPIQRLGAWIKRSMPGTPVTSSSSAPEKFATSIAASRAQSRQQTPTTTTTTTTLNAPFYSCNPTLPSTTAYTAQSQHRPSTSRSRSRSSSSSSRTATATLASASASTTAHARQESNDTATVTLFSTSTEKDADDDDEEDSIPSTPPLSTHSLSPGPTDGEGGNGGSAGYSPPTPGTLTGEAFAASRGRKGRKKVPEPLVLGLGKEVNVDGVIGVGVGVEVESVRSVASVVDVVSASEGKLQPPKSPHYGILPGMEVPVRNSGSVCNW